MEPILLEIVAPIFGLFLGTVLVSRVGAWVQMIVTMAKSSSSSGTPKSRVALVAVLSSGPWMLAGVIFWAYYVLSQEHQRAWDWFFGAAAVSIPAWLIFMFYFYQRAKRNQSSTPKDQNAG